MNISRMTIVKNTTSPSIDLHVSRRMAIATLPAIKATNVKMLKLGNGIMLMTSTSNMLRVSCHHHIDESLMLDTPSRRQFGLMQVQSPKVLRLRSMDPTDRSQLRAHSTLPSTRLLSSPISSPTSPHIGSTQDKMILMVAGRSRRGSFLTDSMDKTSSMLLKDSSKT